MKKAPVTGRDVNCNAFCFFIFKLSREVPYRLETYHGNANDLKAINNNMIMCVCCYGHRYMYILLFFFFFTQDGRTI